MPGRSPKQKGTRGEHKVRKVWDGEPGCGEYRDYSVEVKARKVGGAPKTYPKWRNGADILAVMEDRQLSDEWEYSMNGRTLRFLLQGKKITCIRMPMSGAIDGFPHDLRLRIWED